MKIIKWTRWEDCVVCVCVCLYDHKSPCNVVCTHFVIEVYYHPWGWGSGLSPSCWLVVLMHIPKQQMDWRCWYTTSNTCMCSHTHTHTHICWPLGSEILHNNCANNSNVVRGNNYLLCWATIYTGCCYNLTNAPETLLYTSTDSLSCFLHVCRFSSYFHIA